MRRNYFIKKKFQTTFLLKFVVLLLVEAMLIAGLFLYVSNDTITAGYLNSTLRVEKTPDFFFISLFLVILIIGLGIGMVGMTIFILLSHQIAGPLYKFENTLKQMAEGDLTIRIDLRKTDQMIEFKEAINALAGSLDARIGGIKKAVAEIDGLLPRADDKEAVSTIRSIFAAVKRDMDRFKVSG